MRIAKQGVNTAELRLPLIALHHQLVGYLGLSVSQIAPNAWRTFIGAEILWGILSGGICQLTLDEFFYCYRPHHISSSKGTYHFAVSEKDLKLVSDMLDSNRNWKSRFFFVKGTDWVCCEEEWATMPYGYFDNTQAYVKESSQKRQLPLYLFYSDVSNTVFFFLIAASACPSITDEQLGFIQRILEIPWIKESEIGRAHV